MEENKKKLSGKIKAGGFVVVVFLLLYIPSLLHWIYGNDIATDLIQYGVIEESVNTDAYLVRDEELLKSPFSGRYIPDVQEGEKVAAHSRIATVLKDSCVELLEQKNEKDLKIIEVQKEKVKNLDFFSEDIGHIEDEIEQKVRQMTMEPENLALPSVKEYKGEIDKLIQKKLNIMGSMDTSDDYTASLKKERDALQAQINQNTKEIVSTNPGIISYVTDEMETLLNPKGLRDITPTFLEQVAEMERQGKNSRNEAAAGKPFAKIIKSMEYYIVATMDEGKASKFKEGDGIRLRINDIGKDFTATVAFKSQKQGNRYVLAIKANKYLSDTVDMRKVNVDIVQNSREGLKVPLNSLRDLNTDTMKATLTVVKKGEASVREVDVDSMDSEYAIISIPKDAKLGVYLYDQYVVNPLNIQEGQVIKQ